MSCKHWTVQQSEEAARVPLHERPFCHVHQRTMEWFGVWACRMCNPYLSAETR